MTASIFTQTVWKLSLHQDGNDSRLHCTQINVNDCSIINIISIGVKLSCAFFFHYKQRFWKWCEHFFKWNRQWLFRNVNFFMFSTTFKIQTFIAHSKKSLKSFLKKSLICKIEMKGPERTQRIRRKRWLYKILLSVSLITSTVKPLITNTSKEFIKCHILHFLIMECCRCLVFN